MTIVPYVIAAVCFVSNLTASSFSDSFTLGPSDATQLVFNASYTYSIS